MFHEVTATTRRASHSADVLFKLIFTENGMNVSFAVMSLYMWDLGMMDARSTMATIRGLLTDNSRHEFDTFMHQIE